MRTLLYITTIVALAGCNAGPDPQLEANKALVTRFTEAQNNWDYAALEELVAPNLRRHCQATPDVDIRSRDEFIELLKSWQNTMPDAHVALNQLVAEGDRVAVHALFTGTQTGPMGEIPPTGLAMESVFVGILRIENGQIAEIWVEWDNLAMLTQLGLFPPPPPPEDA
jgi:predicted ester cyclase